LWNLPDLAAELRIAGISLKDESMRSPLGSFKVLGAPVALLRLIGRLWPEHNFEAGDLMCGRHREILAALTVISATDGNHGRALAAAAQSIGCRCVIVLHAKVSGEREQAIASCGAQIVRIAGNYDDSVSEAARLAAANGWYVVSDTSYDGYEEIPRDVMQGYGAIAAELIDQTSALDQPAFTPVFLQGGVGGLAAGVACTLWEHYGPNRPRFVVVEPHEADCLYQSALRGQPTPATGSTDSLMAGLACGEASPLAWKLLQPCIDFFMTVGDDDAVAAMRRLAVGSKRDIPVVAGESGAAGLAGLMVACEQPALAQQLGLDGNARVLLVNTEGATAPSVYRELVEESAQSVMRRRDEWLGQKPIA
jgi:diaminopropionate ammonia-lyase